MVWPAPYITPLKSLHAPGEDPERKPVRREARKQLSRLVELFASVAWQYARKWARVLSMENLAELLAPENQPAMHLQSLEDSCCRRMWHLINAFGEVR
jgi:hypothetical protein